MKQLSKQQMNDFYKKMRLVSNGVVVDPVENQRIAELRKRIYAEMDEFYAQNPTIPTVLLKSRIHTLLAKYFEPVIFRGNPFYFEMGIRKAESWGLDANMNTPVKWMWDKISAKLYAEQPLSFEIATRIRTICNVNEYNVCRANATFDGDHKTLGYTELFRIGVNGLISKAKAKLDEFDEHSEERAFCESVIEGCNAILTVAHKFSERAKELLDSCESPKEREYMQMIADTAARIPAQPPATFYEGLAMLLFMRECVGSLESRGISQLGHVDRLLIDLYRADIAEGRLTEEQARELVGLWMMHTDIKFHVESNSWPETSTCIQLGGCDADGNVVFNEVTKIFIEEHLSMGLVNPKLNCRYSSESPDEYLKLMGEAVLKGHNSFVAINDNSIIPQLMKVGVEERDARMYVNGGCQETMIEGLGHTEGAAVYVSMARILDLCLRRDGEFEVIKPIGEPNSFEELYRRLIFSARRFIKYIIDARNYRQRFNKDIFVSPLFSATQEGCIENGKDVIQGGAKYNFSTVALCGLATVVDSLYAIKTLVYDEKSVSFKEILSALEANWEGYDDLRKKILSLSKFGHGEDDIDALGARFLEDVFNIVLSNRNERGGQYIPSIFVYYYHEYFSHSLRATPDGRHDFDLTSMGCAPSQLKPPRDITKPLVTLSKMPFVKCGGGNDVIDVQLPLTNNMTPDIFAAFLRSCIALGIPTLQPNVVSVEDMIAAKSNPEKYAGLVVRICGLSAYFVSLNPAVQDEVINRHLYSV